MKIMFNNHEMILHHSGILIWPKHQIAVVSDLHLEKGSHFAKRGFFLPPYDSVDTLKRLLDVCTALTISKLIVLGDNFHDPKGYERLSVPARQLFDQLQQFNPVWITGNHDGDFVTKEFTSYESFDLDGITFRHEAIPGAVNEISGHYHPKMDIIYKKARLNKDCFVTDSKKIIMPAFGSYTGGLNVDHPSIKDLLDNPFNLYALGEERVFSLSSDKFSIL